MAACTTVLHTLTNHKSSVNTAIYNNGSTYLLTGSQDRQIALHNPTTGSLVQSYSGHGYEVLSLACAKDNTKFASSGGDRSVFLWDVKTGLTSRKFTGHEGKVNAVALNDDDSVLASGKFQERHRSG
jgi:mitogen-activated protein kinase organizer 1